MPNWKTTQLPTLGPVLEFPFKFLFNAARKIFGWFTRKRIRFIGKWGAVVAICLGTLLALLHFIENKRGKREWDRVKAELEAKGIPMDWRQQLPEPIPDELNFVAAPVIAHFQYRSTSPHHVPWQARWGDEAHFKRLLKRGEGGIYASESFIHEGETVWHESRFETNERTRERLKSEGTPIIPAGVDPWEELEASITPHRQLLVEMRTAAKTRPKAYIQGNYTGTPFEAPMPSFGFVRNLTHLLFADALCALRDDDVERALENAQTIHRLGNLNPDLHFLVNSMIEVVVRKGFEIPIYQLALREGLLDDDHLNKLIAESLRRNALKKFEQSIKLEIAGGSETIVTQLKTDAFLLSSTVDPSWSERLSEFFWKTVFTSMPEGWTYIMASRCAHYMSIILDPYDEETRTLDLETIERNRQTLDEMIRSARFFNLLAAMTVPSLDKVVEASLILQSQEDMLGIACALELYRRKNDNLPERLEALVPSYLPTLHKDPASGENYRYERLNQDQYRLWAVGIDGSDDGGQTEASGDVNDHADIVWPFSPRFDPSR